MSENKNKMFTMSDYYNKYVSNNEIFDSEYNNLKNISKTKKNSNSYIYDIIKDIMVSLLDEKNLNRNQLDSIYMWFNDTLNLQDIVDTDVNKMLEKQE